MEKMYCVRGYKGKYPVIPESCTIMENCVLIGDVHLGENCTIMPGCVLRAEYNPIIIGRNTNIQEFTCIHAERGEKGSVVVGENVTIGHKALLHGCTINDDTLIGMNATVMNFSTVGRHCIIGACAMVKEKDVIPDNSVAFGIPAQVKRKCGEKDIEYIDHAAAEYLMFAEEYKK